MKLIIGDRAAGQNRPGVINTGHRGRGQERSRSGETSKHNEDQDSDRKTLVL